MSQPYRPKQRAILGGASRVSFPFPIGTYQDVLAENVGGRTPIWYHSVSVYSDLTLIDVQKTYRRRSETIRNNVLRRAQYGRRNRDLEDPYECQLPSINKIGSSFHSMWCLSITDKAGYFKIWHEEDYDFYKALTFRCGRKRSLLEISLEKCKICTLCLSLLCTRKAKPFIPFININKN